MTTRVLAAPSSLNFASGGGSRSRLGLSSVPDACLSRVKRCLFGPRSAEEAVHQAKLVAAELERQTELDCKRWNFDFVNEKPAHFANETNRFVWFPASPAAASTTTTSDAINDAAPLIMNNNNADVMDTTPAPCGHQRMRQPQITGKGKSSGSLFAYSVKLIGSAVLVDRSSEPRERPCGCIQGRPIYSIRLGYF